MQTLDHDQVQLVTRVSRKQAPAAAHGFNATDL